MNRVELIVGAPYWISGAGPMRYMGLWGVVPVVPGAVPNGHCLSFVDLCSLDTRPYGPSIAYAHVLHRIMPACKATIETYMVSCRERRLHGAECAELLLAELSPGGPKTWAERKVYMLDRLRAGREGETRRIPDKFGYVECDWPAGCNERRKGIDSGIAMVLRWDDTTGRWWFCCFGCSGLSAAEMNALMRTDTMMPLTEAGHREREYVTGLVEDGLVKGDVDEILRATAYDAKRDEVTINGVAYKVRQRDRGEEEP